MNYTIEDAIEILNGKLQKPVNIRLDTADQKLIKSLSNQFRKSIALTDRQLDLCLMKIEKYRIGLKSNLVDVDHLLTNVPLRMPLREIDRTKRVSLIKDTDGKTKIHIKFVFSKKFGAIWNNIAQQTSFNDVSNQEKTIPFKENTLYLVVNELKELDFEFTNEVMALYNEIDEIIHNPINYVPYIDYNNNTVEVKNISNYCQTYLDTLNKDEDFLVKIAQLKNCGIYHKSRRILAKIAQDSPSFLIKTILQETSTRFRLLPSQYDIDTIIGIINRLKQTPLLIIVNEQKDVTIQVKTIVNSLLKVMTTNEINVFFRLNNTDEHGQEFNEYVRNNKLNNYIDETTKVVIITRNRIPKPLFSSNWKPTSAIVFEGYDHGKIAAFLKDIPNVYYFNESLNTRYDRHLGLKEIVQL